METKNKKVTFFDILNDLMYTKDKLLENDFSAYSPYMINRGLSQQPDLIFMANEMNKSASNLTKEMQYDFYFHSIKAKKRFGKWAKSDDDDEAIQTIMQVYDVSRLKALEYYEMLSPDNIKNIKSLVKGGLKK